jgi:hypothetical protein
MEHFTVSTCIIAAEYFPTFAVACAHLPAPAFQKPIEPCIGRSEINTNCHCHRGSGYSIVAS